MIDPFDAEFLSQELRDAWKKIEELEKENAELKYDENSNKDLINLLKQKVDKLEEELDFYKTRDMLNEKYGREREG